MGFGRTIKRRAHLARNRFGASGMRPRRPKMFLLEQIREKWEPVFPPDLRRIKELDRFGRFCHRLKQSSVNAALRPWFSAIAKAAPPMSAATQTRRRLPGDIRAQKGAAPIVCLTAYTTPMARLADAHCDLVLVGDGGVSRGARRAGHGPCRADAAIGQYAGRLQGAGPDRRWWPGAAKRCVGGCARPVVIVGAARWSQDLPVLLCSS